jgi:hypothetical protein
MVAGETSLRCRLTTRGIILECFLLEGNPRSEILAKGIPSSDSRSIQKRPSRAAATANADLQGAVKICLSFYASDWPNPKCDWNLPERSVYVCKVDRQRVAPVSWRRYRIRQLAALVAIWALAINVALGSFAHCHPAAVDAFGEPICSHHAEGNAGQQPLPTAPDDFDSACCQCCGTLPLTISTDLAALPTPTAVEWNRAVVVAADGPLLPPSHHLIGPPRGPPFAPS